MAQEKLHVGARWLFRFRAYGTALAIPIFLLFLVVPLIGAIIQSHALTFVLVIFLAYIIIFLIISEIYARLSYNNWFYEFTDTNLKLERGIIWKRYSNVPYERVQNVDIRRGIMARIFGFSSVMIQTAGYSMPVGNRISNSAEGYIPAVSVENAEKIRDFLMKKISKAPISKQGL